MEIQAQTVIPTATSSNVSSNANGAAAASGLTDTSKTGFSATLNGLLAGDAAVGQEGSQVSLAGLNAIAQLMAALKEDATDASDQSMQDSLKQLDDLIAMLDSDSEDASDLVSNPGVQAWLAQIQALLLVQSQTVVSMDPTQSNNTADVSASDANEAVSNMQIQSAGKENSNNLNPLLFVPLNTADNGSTQTSPDTDLEPVTKAEAKKLLESFKDLLKANHEVSTTTLPSNAMQKVVADLNQILAPLLAAHTASDTAGDSITDSEVASQFTAAQPADRPKVTAAPAQAIRRDTTVQVNVSSINPKLELLAAKILPPRLAVEETKDEAPLFEPLQELAADSTADNNVMPMHEFLKHVQSGEQVTKTPVLLMHAHSFPEDMAEFVIKSFTLDARAQGITEAKLSLYPQHLGQVDVKLTLHNGQLIAQFMADSVSGKEMLESQLSQLKSTLQSQGIQVEKLEVTQSQSFQSGMFQEQRQQQSQQSNKQQKGNGTNRIAALDEETVQDETSSRVVSGSSGQASIDTTA